MVCCYGPPPVVFDYIDNYQYASVWNGTSSTVDYTIKVWSIGWNLPPGVATTYAVAWSSYNEND
jgi:hypothetical protein